MRIEDVPERAFTQPATPIPTKTVVVHDWEALYQTLLAEGFIVIESDDTRTVNGTNAIECVHVKAFNSYLRQARNFKVRLQTKRIGKTRWVCAL